MTKLLNEQEIIRLKKRLQSRLDYYVVILVWGLCSFSFLSTLFIGSLDPDHGGLSAALQVAPIFLFFPVFALIGAVSDRILVKDLYMKSNVKKFIISQGEKSRSRLVKEDYIRIGITIFLIFISLPWIAARLGLFLRLYDSTLMSDVFFFQPVHLGEHHGWIGIYMILCVLLLSKTEKLYLNSIFKELFIYLLCFLLIWGIGLLLNDFTYEQMHFTFPFLVWGTDTNFFWGLSIQILIVAALSFPLYYFGWYQYYKKVNN